MRIQEIAEWNVSLSRFLSLFLQVISAELHGTRAVNPYMPLADDISFDVNIILKTFMDQAVWQFALFIPPLHCEGKKSYSYLTCVQNNIIQF